MESSFNTKENTQQMSALRASIANSTIILAAKNTFLGHEETEAWLFRDDIGAPHGIKGYEEQVNSVGMHHGHNHWPSSISWNTYNSATLRRGFKVWQRACQGCHGAMHQKYDLMVDKGFKQRELMN